VRDKVVEANVVVEGVWPEIGLQVRTGKHSAKSIADGLMRAFAGSILVRRVRTGEFHGISEVCECAVDVAAFPKLPASIHADIFVGALWRVAGEPAVDPINRRGFRGEGATEDPTTKVVGQQNIARFAIEADESVVSSRVPTLLDHESKVDRKALIACRRSHRCLRSFWSLSKFGGKANGTSFELGRECEFGHPFYKTMHF